MARIHLLLADDHEEFRRTLRELLEEEPDLRVVAEAENGRQAVSLARELSPDIVLMDVEMPVLDGAMLEAGAAGSLPKDEDLPNLIRVIRAIARRSHHDPFYESMSEEGRWDRKESDHVCYDRV